MLSANNGQNYYHIDEENARKHFDIRKRDITNVDWFLYHVRENGADKGMKLLDSIRREKPKSYRHKNPAFEREMERLDNQGLDEIALMMKRFAKEENELENQPRRK